MPLHLTEEQKRRIEQEEQARHVEEQYRAVVRGQMAAGAFEQPRRFKRWKLLALLFVLGILCLFWWLYRPPGIF
jgi:hypothetical protein